jgi:hypothetical protein
VTVPCVSAPALAAATVSVWPFSLNGPATSFANRNEKGTVTAVLLGPCCRLGTVVVGFETFMVVAGVDWPCPSLAVKVNVSMPLKSGAGV